MNSYSKYFEKIRVRPDKGAGVKEDAPRCQWEGCEEAGLYRAPVGRAREGEYFRFCLDHVRQYNKSYNYFSGLEDNEISRFQKDAMTGHRPTWAVGGNSETRAAPDFSTLRSGPAGYYNRLRDPFGLMGGGVRRKTAPSRRTVKPLEAKALETLGLDENATGAEIKAHYKTLVKRHHPDTNGGDRGSEERFRSVMQAYKLLKQAGLC